MVDVKITLTLNESNLSKLGFPKLFGTPCSFEKKS